MSEISWRFAGKAVYDAAAFAERLEQRGFEIGPELSMANSFTNLRGRKPSIGKILMLKEDILAIEDHQEAKHSLVIKDGAKTLEFKNLCVVKSQAIWPNIDKEKEETTATTPYLVTIADGRYYARYGSAVGRFPAVEPTGAAPHRDERERWFDEIEQLLRNHSFGDIRANWTATEFNVQGHGSRWDTLWAVLDKHGASVALDSKGVWVSFKLDHFMDNRDELKNAKPCLIDGAAWLESPMLPDLVQVHYPKFDYQWHKSIYTNTAVDKYRIDYSGSDSFFAKDLLHDPQEMEWLTQNRLPWKQTKGTAAVWSSIPEFVADDGTSRYGTADGMFTKEGFDNILKSRARTYLRRQIALQRQTSWEFIGAWKILPWSRWGSVVYRDTGGGLTTTIVSTELDLNEQVGKWEVQKDETSPPDEIDQQPYGRELYCSVGRPFGLSAGADADCDTILPDQMCHVAAYSGHLTPTVSPNATSVTWQLRRALVAVNATGRPVKVGRFGFAKWNYQIGVGGIWCLVSADGTKWEASCDVKGKETFSIEDPGLIKVNRRAMLRLLDLTKQGCPSPQAIGIDFQEGPPNTVLWTAPDKTIYWTDSPILKNVTLAGSHLKFKKGLQEEVWLSGPKFTEKAELGHRILLPAIPPRSDAIVIAENTGPSNTTQLGWFGPGLNSEVSTLSSYMILENFAQWMQNVADYGSPIPPGEDWPNQTITFRSGILMAASDSTGAELPEEQYNPGDEPTVGSAFNPCSSLTPPSPGEDVEETECDNCKDGKAAKRYSVVIAGVRSYSDVFTPRLGGPLTSSIDEDDQNALRDLINDTHVLESVGGCSWNKTIEYKSDDVIFGRTRVHADVGISLIARAGSMELSVIVVSRLGAFNSASYAASFVLEEDPRVDCMSEMTLAADVIDRYGAPGRADEFGRATIGAPVTMQDIDELVVRPMR